MRTFLFWGLAIYSLVGIVLCFYYSSSVKRYETASKIGKIIVITAFITTSVLYYLATHK